MAAAASRRPAQSGSQLKASAVAVLLLLPMAVGGGILVGRSGSDDGGSADLAAAIRDGGLAGGSADGSSDTTLASDTGGSLTSDFSLDKGYAVQLNTLPSSSDADAVQKAEDDAKSKGADDVGVILPADFTVTPDPGGDLVVYSGEFDKKPDAEAALKKLKGDFPDATVITVKGSGSSGADTDPSNGAGGKLVDQSKYGDVHQVEGIEPTEADQEEGSQIAQEQADETGGDYIDSQQGLPDVIAVGQP